VWKLSSRGMSVLCLLGGGRNCTAYAQWRKAEGRRQKAEVELRTDWDVSVQHVES
jgi:hypothetical protein